MLLRVVLVLFSSALIEAIAPPTCLIPPPAFVSIKHISAEKGFGVVANAEILAGQFLGDYVGETLPLDVKDRLYLASKKHLRTPADDSWIASREERGVSLTGSYLFAIGDEFVFDAEDPSKSSWCRFLNHSPNPNCKVKTMLLAYGGPRVWFVTIHDIEANEELTFDYGPEYFSPDDEIV